MVNDFITANEWNIAFAKNIHKKPIIDQLNLFSNELTDYGDTVPENDENDKLLEQYKETKTETKATLARLQQVISQKEVEQEEKEKQLVQSGKEKQLEIEQRNKEKQMKINA